MKRPTLAFAVLLLPLVAAFQDDRGQDPIGRDPIPGEEEQDDPVLGLTPLTPAEKLYDEIQGCWQLATIESNLIGAAGREMSGYLLIGDGFLSVEIHMVWSRGEKVLEDAFQSGIHEFTLDDFSTLRTTSLIGATLDNHFEIEWERAGVVREYQVTQIGAFLELRRTDGSVYVFSRRPSHTGRNDRDIFGNPLPGKARRDMYGRTIEEEEEELDPLDLPVEKKPADKPVGDGDNQN